MPPRHRRPGKSTCLPHARRVSYGGALVAGAFLAGACGSGPPAAGDLTPPEQERDSAQQPDRSADLLVRDRAASPEDLPTVHAPDAPSSDAPPAPAGWKLSWSDEFNGAAGQPPDSSKWNFEIGGNGWGNNELEFYTNRRENSALDGNGHLVITVLSEVYMGRNFTSARLTTKGKFAQTYGRFEARLKVPSGQGLWPAFWALGNDIDKVQWPTCGEIDIMENVGREPSINHGTLHGPGYSGGGGVSATYTLPAGKFATDFHTFAVEWEMNVVRFYVDDLLYKTRTPVDLPAGTTWVYDHPFFLILNVAVGGPFPGNPDGTTVLPQTLTVDYVRVYTR